MTSPFKTESTVTVTFPGTDRGSEISSLLIRANASEPEQVDQSNFCT